MSGRTKRLTSAISKYAPGSQKVRKLTIPSISKPLLRSSRQQTLSQSLRAPIQQADIMTNQSPSPTISFYSGGFDHRERSLDDILAWSDYKLEMSHDYIQWLFPLPESSPYNPWAPRLDDASAKTFRNNPDIQRRMRQSFYRMLKFYGFEATTSNTRQKIIPLSTFDQAAQNWVNSHNDLRITRIIRSLRCCGLDDEAHAFYEALKHVYNSRKGYPRRVSDNSYMYWQRAAKRPLEIPPNMDDNRAEAVLREKAAKTTKSTNENIEDNETGTNTVDVEKD